MAQEVNTISTTSLNPFEITDLTRKICDTITPKLGEGHAFLTPLIEDSLVHCDALLHAVSRARSSELTQKLSEINEERQISAQGFLKGVDYYLNHHNSDFKAAAEQLIELIDMQGRRFFRESNRNHTLKLQQLLQDLSTEESQASLATLQLTEFYTTLQAKNEEFITTSQQRNEEEARDNTPLVRPTRKILRDNLVAFESFLTFHGRLDEPQWGEIIRVVNEQITDVQAAAKGRKTRSEDEDIAATNDSEENFDLN